MKSPKISIIIPSYNKGKYIEDTLISIVSQKYPNLEVIIQDGSSTDGTLEVIKKYAQKYPYIVWESKKDKGQLDAINKGLNKATGDFVTFINADDVYLVGALRKVGGYLKIHPNTLWLAGRGEIINKQGKEISSLVTKYKGWLLRKNDYRNLLAVNYLMQPSVFVSRQGYKKYGQFTGVSSWVMEYNMWLKLGQVEMPAIINQTLTGFRMTGKNVSAVNFKKILLEDDRIAGRFTNNPLILMIHYLHNIARIIINFVANYA